MRNRQLESKPTSFFSPSPIIVFPVQDGSSHPLRLEPPGDFYAFFTGDSFFITCIPDPEIGANRLAWQTPNKKDITHTRGRVHVEPSAHNILGLELVVEEVRYRDQGVFICSAVVDGREIRITFTLKVYHLEVNCGKRIEKIADKARKRLKILKYLSGRDWGSDASTLRITYTTLVRPVLEYGYQIFQVPYPTNLKTLERVQLSAPRIITGLRYSCPTDIVLYEADVQPLTMRFEVNSYSPLNYMRKHGFIDFNVDTSTPISCITPIDSFNHVEFREELLTSTPKHSSLPELLRQLALEVINGIPDQALIIYTDDSRSDTGEFASFAYFPYVFDEKESTFFTIHNSTMAEKPFPTCERA
ncbi:RNase H domain-containing protein [Trichonephila inaurata madagascariensis]|uniref:RNase H domain-containing protein n=1 Tax=Trichonephila inaurata madagascariensis TaxID=2747483 RepID=A0A8X7CIN0_9ARAC|nr:RNase H domain-containing protein [Trichonephila inaurata madagascariensis]